MADQKLVQFVVAFALCFQVCLCREFPQDHHFHRDEGFQDRYGRSAYPSDPSVTVEDISPTPYLFESLR